ncbi:MAG: hypothetical protein AABZ47_14825 [Planctomycetota bacterium]
MLRKHTYGFFVLGVAILPLFASAQTSKKAVDPSEPGEPAAAVESAEIEKVAPPGDAVALIRQAVPRVDWEDFPFEDFLEWIRERGDNRVNVVARWASLNEEGVDAEKTITLKLTHATVGAILREVTDQLSVDRKLAFRATSNFITISTKADFDRDLVLQVYDVSDILFRVPDFQREAPQIDLSGQSSGGGAGGSGGGGKSGVFQNSGGGGQQQGQENEQQAKQRLEELRNAILKSVAPDSWSDVPGQGSTGGRGGGGAGLGTITVINNRSLIIYNTIEVHEQIAGSFVRGK